jgi:predicted DNA binding CopG/RHH family protein
MKKQYDIEPIDKEEAELIDAFENGTTSSISSDIKKNTIKQAKLAAKSYLDKNKNINIRITERDVQKLKTKAAETGLPYQTLIASVLHQYANGKVKVEL